MRVLIISSVFPPEPVVSAKTSAEIATYLSSNGDDVTVIAPFPNRPGGKLYAGYKRRWWMKNKHSDNYTLIRCFSTLSGKSTFLHRFIENLSFGITGGIAALFYKKPDVIYCNTWPIFATGLIYIVTKSRKIPLVVSVQDVYPESLVVQNRLQSKAHLVRLFTSIDRRIARGCQAIIVICESFANIYRKSGISPNRIHVVPNWGNPESIIIDETAGHELRAKLNIPKQAFLCLYAGNIGRAAGVESCIEAFQYLKFNKNIYLLIAGEGSQLNACQILAKHIKATRIIFLSPWSESETTAVMSSADCLLLPTQGQQSLASVPSKMISYLFAGKPIISMSLEQSETARTVVDSQCGLVIPPDDPVRLADAICELHDLPDRVRVRMGRSGIEYASKNLSSNICLPRIRAILQTVK